MRFKEFLKEDVNTYPELEIEFNYRFSLDVSDRTKLATGLNKLNIKDVIRTEIDPDTILFTMKFNDPLRYDRYSLEEKHKMLKSDVEQVLFDIDTNNELYEAADYLLINKDLPTFPVSYPRINIEIEPKMNFSNLYKFIDSNTDFLGIHGFEKIEPHKGLLNILRLKTKDIVLISSSYQPLWWKIYNKHLNGDRDMLDCQEELVRHGFKEYAR